jgi:glycerol-3-phosphate acyltransferase PlsX
MENALTVVVDAMGGDVVPSVPVEGAVIAAREFGTRILLTGPQDVVNAELSRHEHAGLPISVVHAEEVVEMTDHAADSAMRKKGSSIRVGLGLVKQGQAQAFVSMGNTGAVMAAALFDLGRIPGVKRPALCTVFPTKSGFCLLLDIGANADCKPEYLTQFALMGTVYAELVLGVKNPSVGIVSNGEEEGKGSELVKQTYALLKTSGLNFVGNVEGKDITAGLANVVVTDGFTGNVIIKNSEGVAKLLMDSIRQEIMRSPVTKLGGLLAKPAFRRVAKMLDYTEFGGAVLLGVDGIVIIGHGRSNAWAVRSAVRVAGQAVRSEVVDTIRRGVSRLAEKGM